MALTDWFLTAAERGNESTVLDAGHADGAAWSTGNEVRALVHGAAYFAELLRCLSTARSGDLVLFTDWRGDPDEALDASGIEVSRALADAAGRGAVVRGLIWRSHLDRFSFSERENRHLGEDIEAAGGQCLLDQRVRPGGSHHQKFVVVRHPGRPEMDVAFVGGIDLCHSRRDDRSHAGDPQRQPMARVYGARPPWHDVQLAVRGPAVADVETVFRERWEDPAPLTRNPVNRMSELVRRDPRKPRPLPAQLPAPPPVGSARVQLLRTYPYRRRGYPFAPDGERSVARAYEKVLARANSLVYLEDQYLWSRDVVRRFADALRHRTSLRMIAVVPHYPDQDGRFSLPPNLVGHLQALRELRAAAPDRVAIYGIENRASCPVYVHAKVCILDDLWASVGSDNINRRSWTHDSELACAVLDDAADARDPTVVDRYGDGARRFARNLRLSLAREHLDRDDGDDGDLIDPVSAFDAFAQSASRLQRWHDSSRAGPRPPGRLRPYALPPLRWPTLLWATPVYRTLYDPDGRPRRLRRTDRF